MSLGTLELFWTAQNRTQNTRKENIKKQIFLDLRQKCMRTESDKKARLHLRWGEGARHARSTLARNTALQSSSAAAPPSSHCKKGFAKNVSLHLFELINWWLVFSRANKNFYKYSKYKTPFSRQGEDLAGMGCGNLYTLGANVAWGIWKSLFTLWIMIHLSKIHFSFH